MVSSPPLAFYDVSSTINVSRIMSIRVAYSITTISHLQVSKERQRKITIFKG